MLRCDSIGEPVSDRAIAAQALTAGCRRAGGCAARRVLTPTGGCEFRRLRHATVLANIDIGKPYPIAVRTQIGPVPILRHHPLFPMVRQRRIRASFDSRCRLSTVKGLVVVADQSLTAYSPSRR